MANYTRPQRDFTIQSTSTTAKPQLDEIAQGTIEGQLAEFIQNDPAIQFALQDKDIEGSKIEAEMMINGEARRLLKQIHENNPSKFQDLSQDLDTIKEIRVNALEIVQDYLAADTRRHAGNITRNEVIPAPVDENDDLAL